MIFVHINMQMKIIQEREKLVVGGVDRMNAGRILRKGTRMKPKPHK